jgi:hypothetical protein
LNPAETNQHLSPALAQEYILETENKCQQDGDGYKKNSQETAIFKAQVRRPARPGGGLAPFRQFSSPSAGALIFYLEPGI